MKSVQSEFAALSTSTVDQLRQYEQDLARKEGKKLILLAYVQE